MFANTGNVSYLNKKRNGYLIGKWKLFLFFYYVCIVEFSLQIICYFICTISLNYGGKKDGKG